MAARYDEPVPASDPPAGPRAGVVPSDAGVVDVPLLGVDAGPALELSFDLSFGLSFGALLPFEA